MGFGRSRSPVKDINSKPAPKPVSFHSQHGFSFAQKSIMRIHAFKLIVMGLFISGSTWASEIPAFCKEPVVALKDSEQKILNPSLTGHLYQRAFLKLAQRLSLENLNTIEA